ncbi:hypothetical protein BGW80DRAFT_1304835 [Lactifluus volemus]|nr:hypothetical protein BGW80DRAFT_1304835 [Lactifluus volemus]
MYQQPPLRPQQTWPNSQFAQGPQPAAVPTWASAPVITAIHNATTTGAIPVPRQVPTQSFVPPVPPGVNPQQWQNGRWRYTGPAAGLNGTQPHGPYPPPSLVGWNIPAGWGITPQYYCPPQQQKQPDRSYWDTKLTNNGLGLENMHIKHQSTSSDEGRDKGSHTPWAWVPRELEDDDDSHSQQQQQQQQQQAGSSAPYQNAPRSHQPSSVAPGGTSGTSGHGRHPSTAPAVAGTGYPAQGHGHPPHAYFSVPADRQQAISNDAGPSSRPTLPPPAVFSAHVRQQSNPHQSTHSQPSASNLPSLPTPSAQALQRSRSHMVIAPTPQRPGQPESFTEVKQLRPTFSPAIVRTPNHYHFRHDSSQPVVPSPLVAPWEDGSAGVSTSANAHLSAPPHGVVPSPRVPRWNSHARANDPDSPTPSPRNPRTSRTDPPRIYESGARPTHSVQRSYSIPEPARFPAMVSRQNSMPIVPTDQDSQSGHSSIANLPHFAEEPGAMLSPLLGTVSSESSESSTSSATTIIIAPSPPPLFIPPRHSSRSPSPSPLRRRSRRRRPSSPPSSSESSDSDSNDGRSPSRRHRSPSASRSRHSTYSGHSSGHSARSSGHYPPFPGAVGGVGAPHTPQQGRSPASSTHTHRSSASSNPLPTPPQERRDPGFSLPPPQMSKPPRGTYGRTLRFGYWNRRGDYLTNDKYVVYAPPDRANPRELERYPAPTQGYMDHFGNFIPYDAKRQELPESLPRQGRAPLLPYEKFVTYVYL